MWFTRTFLYHLETDSFVYHIKTLHVYLFYGNIINFSIFNGTLDSPKLIDVQYFFIVHLKISIPKTYWSLRCKRQKKKTMTKFCCLCSLWSLQLISANTRLMETIKQLITILWNKTFTTLTVNKFKHFSYKFKERSHKNNDPTPV